MERMLVLPSGVEIRLEDGIQHDVATTMTHLSVHFDCVTMATATSTDYNFYFSTPFSSILHESRWEREREVRRMMVHVAGNLVHPHDLHFLTRTFCDYSQDALRSFYEQGGSGGDLLYIHVLLQIPEAAASGPYHPPPIPHLPHAVVEPQLQFHPPDIAIDPYNLLARAYLPNATATADPYDPLSQPHILHGDVGLTNHFHDIDMYNLHQVQAYLPNTTIAGGPYNPPLPPHLPHAVFPSLQQPHLSDISIDSYDLWVQVVLAAPPPEPHDEPSQPQPHLPDIAVDLDDHLMQVPFPEFILSPLNAAEHLGNNPTSASVVWQLERVTFGEATNGHCRETSCAICIDDFEATSVLSVMPCGHSFHSACLDEWLVRSNACPLCRFSLPAVN
ncbi:RING finger protein 44-like [Zingiber officinale]|uniref:RING-type domain-containing protein n=1 Tax=Zingiber officinale TaxID=94328 RepID=A0A8J5L6P1_ZINOF|nr:RING finger protein 44-like [Zingiber officinale]KAG6502495.1 hypothetical protein ZIOFF_034776 [Zingiber officinale]